MIDITIGSAADVAEIMHVMNAAFDPSYGEAWTAGQCVGALTMPSCKLLLARIDGALAGFAMTRWIWDEEELLLIAVSPNFRRSGAGAALIKDVTKSAIEGGRKTIFLEVRQGNSAIQLYEKIGFIQVGLRKDYYSGSNGEKLDAITMRLSLQV